MKESIDLSVLPSSHFWAIGLLATAIVGDDTSYCCPFEKFLFSRITRVVKEADKERVKRKKAGKRKFKEILKLLSVG